MPFELKVTKLLYIHTARVTVLLGLCLSVCLSVTTCSATAHNASFRSSEVMAPFAYRESHQRYYRDPELIPRRHRVIKLFKSLTGR